MKNKKMMLALLLSIGAIQTTIQASQDPMNFPYDPNIEFPDQPLSKPYPWPLPQPAPAPIKSRPLICMTIPELKVEKALVQQEISFLQQLPRPIRAQKSQALSLQQYLTQINQAIHSWNKINYIQAMRSPKCKK